MAPLHQAVYHMSIEIVKYLIQQGADVNLIVEDVDENESRASALGCAVQKKNNLEIVKLLIEHGAQPFLGSEGYFITLLEEALELGNKEVIQALNQLC